MTVDISLQDREGLPIELAAVDGGLGAGGRRRRVLQVEMTNAATGGGTDVSSLATEATLVVLKNLIATQIEIASTLWTDDSGAFFVRRDTVSEQAGTVTVGWFTPQGVAATPGVGLRPASGSRDYEITSTPYTATVAGTGYSVGDALIHALVMEVSGTAPSVAASVWLNVSTGVVLGTAPTGANVSLLAPLPVGASTSANQGLIKAALDSITAKLTADPSTAALQTSGNALLGQIRDELAAQSGGGGTPTGTVGSPAAQVVTVQGIAGGKALKAAPEVDMQVTGASVVEHVYGVGELWSPGNIYMSGAYPTQAILDGLLIIVGGNHTCDLDILFVRYDNYGGENTPPLGTTMASIDDTLVSAVWATTTLEPSMTIGDYTVYEAHGLGIVLKDWFRSSYMPILAAPRGGSMSIGTTTPKNVRLVTHLTFPASA